MKGIQRKESADTRMALAGTSERNSTLHIPRNSFPKHVVPFVPLVSPERARDATYNDVFEADMVLKMKHPFRKPGTVLRPAFVDAMIAMLLV